MSTTVSRGPLAGTDLISNGATAGQVPVADGFNRTFWTTLASPIVGLKGDWSNFIESAADGVYTVVLYASYACTIDLLKIITASGTCTANLKINATSVTGISAVAVTSTIATGTATAANTVAIGDKITLTLSASSTPVGLAFSILTTRT